MHGGLQFVGHEEANPRRLYNTEFHGESAFQDHCDSSHSYFSIYAPHKALCHSPPLPLPPLLFVPQCVQLYDVMCLTFVSGTNCFYSLTVEDTESSDEHLSPAYSPKRILLQHPPWM